MHINTHISELSSASLTNGKSRGDVTAMGGFEAVE